MIRLAEFGHKLRLVPSSLLIDLYESKKDFYNAAQLCESEARKTKDDGERRKVLLKRSAINYNRSGMNYDVGRLFEELEMTEEAIENYLKGRMFSVAAILARKKEDFNRSLEFYERAITDCEGRGWVNNIPVWYQDAARFCVEASDLCEKIGLKDRAKSFKLRAAENFLKGRADVASARLYRELDDEPKSREIYEKAVDERCERGELSDAARIAEEFDQKRAIEIYNLLGWQNEVNRLKQLIT